ncbi:sensor histidine kinase [Curtobacterium sp. 22159]|uniref:sensor histidine kinase n=1 Tax=Curtobacterium sp. 22159 TaxID=3453882 RepID=UPI003F87D7EC
MTLLTGQDPTDLTGGRSRSGAAWGLNALGIAIVGFWFVKNGLALHHPAWVWVLGAVALAAWAAREFGRTTRVLVVAGVVMVAAGALTVVPTVSLMIVPVIVGIVLIGANLRAPVWASSVAALGAVVVIAASAWIDGVSVQFVLGTAGGLVMGVLIGFSRRQFRVAAVRAREAEEEQQRARLLADRSRAARDIHDVLAHSLGGLVLQLDAVEALLEAGRVDEARKRAGDARTLAADGLAEARRAVHALRDDPETDVRSAPEVVRPSRPSTEPSTGLAALVEAHRSFGGEIVTQGDTALTALDASHRDAVVQVVREALSNARRHAPAAGVTLSVIRDGDAVDVVVANPLSGGGHGLLGMRERFDELGSGATVEAERSDDEFVVAMHLPVDPAHAAEESS